MKREQLERANKIEAEIKRLQELDKVIIQSCNGVHKLAAVSTDCYGHFEVLSETTIPPIILAKFRQIIADEVVKLDEEFESL